MTIDSHMSNKAHLEPPRNTNGHDFNAAGIGRLQCQGGSGAASWFLNCFQNCAGENKPALKAACEGLEEACCCISSILNSPCWPRKHFTVRALERNIRTTPAKHPNYKINVIMKGKKKPIGLVNLPPIEKNPQLEMCKYLEHLRLRENQHHSNETRSFNSCVITVLSMGSQNLKEQQSLQGVS